MNLNECSQGTRRKSGSFLTNKKLDYSFYFLMALCQTQMPRSARCIAQEGGISFAFLQKVAHLLKRAGIVIASRGKGGGYVLARAPRAITIKDIMAAVEGATVPLACVKPLRTQRSCPRINFCQARFALARAQREVMEQYFSKKLSDMVCER